MIKPEPLVVGDTIALVAPASWTDRVEETVAALRQRGFQVKLGANLDKREGNFAGSDRERAEALMKMWRDPEVKGLWCLRGGYGAGRILDALDYDYIRAHPKIFIGMSDITALHTAINQKSGVVTFLGPIAVTLFDDDPMTEEELWKQLLDPNEIGLYPNPLECRTLAGGTARGQLAGGNLALICAHIGTPWQLETRGKILILEDVGEFAYRVDRMLNQMKQAGMLEDLAGLILASWRDCHPGKAGDWSIEEVFEDYFKTAPYPVILGFPSGHIGQQVTLPLGCLAELSGERKELILLERGVEVLR